MVRRLTAIMFADMVGHTALMQEDERRAMELRGRQRDVLDRVIVAHGGEVLQRYGDATLSVFPSAVEGVLSAIEIQRDLSSHPPAPIRIGLHSGDIVHDEDGVCGDGVNVASRIQSLSSSGGILISEKVFDEVKNQADISTHHLGEFDLKNVKSAMGAYAVVNDGLPAPGDDELEGHRARGGGPSIAVLPFVSMSSGEDNEFFSDGISEEIINALTRINGLRVTARTSSFAFKNETLDIRDVARQLSVSHVLEGSVRRAGDRVRVTAQLICAADGYHLFSEVYDRKLEDIFAVQDDIAQSIVHELAEQLAPIPTASAPADAPLVRAHSHDTEAYAEYLRGRFQWAQNTPQSWRTAIKHFERSVEMDADCGLPHIGLATAHVGLGIMGQMPADTAFPRAEAEALAALELESDSGEAHIALSGVKLFYDWDWEGAYHCAQKALSLSPGSPEVQHLYGMYLMTIGAFDDAVEALRTAVGADPLSPINNHALGWALLSAGRLDEAEDVLQKTLRLDPSFRAATDTLGWIRMERGDPEGALKLFQRFAELAGSPYAGLGPRGYAYGRLGRSEDARRMLALLDERAAAEPDVNLDMDRALVYRGLDAFDEMSEQLNRAVDSRVGYVVFLPASAHWDAEVRADPRWDKLLSRIQGTASAAA